MMYFSHYTLYLFQYRDFAPGERELVSAFTGTEDLYYLNAEEKTLSAHL